MSRGRIAAIVCTWLALPIASTSAQQSLADVARKEEARRKQIQEPARVYTNKDLRPAPTPSPESKADDKAAAEPSPSDKDTGKTQEKGKAEKESGEAAKEPASQAAASKPEPVKDKAYWADRLKSLQDQLARDQTYSDALQSRINALTTDFVNRDDPAQKAQIERDRIRAINELDRLKLAIPADKKAIDDLLEEARRAGVPPGWLR